MIYKLFAYMDASEIATPVAARSGYDGYLALVALANRSHWRKWHVTNLDTGAVACEKLDKSRGERYINEIVQHNARRARAERSKT